MEGSNPARSTCKSGAVPLVYGSDKKDNRSNTVKVMVRATCGFPRPPPWGGIAVKDPLCVAVWECTE